MLTLHWITIPGGGQVWKLRRYSGDGEKNHDPKSSCLLRTVGKRWNEMSVVDLNVRWQLMISTWDSYGSMLRLLGIFHDPHFFVYLYREHFARFIRNAKCESSKHHMMKLWWPVSSAQGIQLMRPKVVADNATTTLSTSVRHSEATDLVITRRRNDQASHPDCLPVDFPLTKRSERCGNIQNMGFVGLASGKCKKNNKIIFDLFWMDGPWLVPMCSTASVYVQLPLLPGNNFHDHQRDGHHHQHDEHQQQHHQQHHDHDNGRYAAVSNLRPWSCASEEIPRYWIYAGWPWKRIIVLLASIKPFKVDFVKSYSPFSLFKIIYC